MIAVFGSNGFVGSEISRALKDKGYEVFEVARENFEKALGKEFDYVINAAMPSARFKAKSNPYWDFEETVAKTHRIFCGIKYKKFIQISSISARCQRDIVYGRHKLAAENLVNDGHSLIVRLGPMFGPSLSKGVLIDMLKGSKVYVHGESRYAFSPLRFNAEWIANNLDKIGIWEVGAKNSIVLQDLSRELGLKVEFEGPTDHQEIQTMGGDYPNSNLVKEFMLSRMICGNKELISCIDIGNQYLSSIFPENLGYRGELKKYPLEIVQCAKTNDSQCGSLQLAYDFDLSEMYEHYPYTSSSNTAMKRILLDVANSGRNLGILRDGDTILDIGGNDGTLLSFFEKENLNLVCIDPAQNVESIVHSDKFVRVNDFFTSDNFKRVSKEKAKLVFGIAMFYHLHDPINFCKQVDEILHDEGVLIVQMAYLPAMIKTNMYDNIVHEHAGYYGMQHMKWVLEKAGLEPFDVELNDVYGGSFRIFAKKRGNLRFQATERLKETLRQEIRDGIFDTKTYSEFMFRVNQTKKKLQELIREIRAQGKKVWIYGASTKGNTIMQFCDIGADLIEAAADANPFKFGKYIIGSDIHIVNEKVMRDEKPDYLLALPYSFVDAFREREKELVESGTKFIVPLPEVKVI
jgi:dTDP-4-dehydrorhamnose reductase/SAM-dependent methyltransferase